MSFQLRLTKAVALLLLDFILFVMRVGVEHSVVRFNPQCG